VSRHFDDLDAVLEFDALDDFGQLIFALQSPPYFCSGLWKETSPALASCHPWSWGLSRGDHQHWHWGLRSFTTGVDLPTLRRPHDHQLLREVVRPGRAVKAHKADAHRIRVLVRRAFQPLLQGLHRVFEVLDAEL
jgi:hypothetical protein